ncbi:Mak10 subunit, NatC N-terminal acetyltransferase-domain-containing protein [Melampsora americana]|nr:Mak10 subunit, NatC N-terminal acetyltransferase-domain-containing protein [Melampsora americana]
MNTELGKDEILISSELAVIDIISAIRIMDHRMDMGMSVNSKELDELKFDPTQSLTPTEVIIILDLSLACEFAWHTGHALSQTLLVSSYLQHLDSLDNQPQDLMKRVLRAALMGTMKCCAIVWNEIVKGHLHENEDINSDCQGVNFYDQFTIEQVLTDLDIAHRELESWLDDSKGIREALMERLRFRIEFLYSLASLTSSPSVRMIQNLQSHLISSKEALDALEHYPQPISTIDFSHSNPKIQSAFDLNASRYMSSNAPPRPIQFCSTFDEVKEKWIGLIDGLIEALDIVHGNSVSEWLFYFGTISRKRETSLPLVRSMLMSVFQEGNTIALDPQKNLQWLSRQCLSEFTNHRIIIKSDEPSTRYILGRLAGLLVNHLTSFSANRPRGRRILCNSLKEWRSLYDATFVTRMEISECELKSLRALIYYFSLRSSLCTFLMGFDLELFIDEEERISMWWMIRGLTRRANKVLEFLGTENTLEARVDLILGDLAEASIQRQIKLIKSRPESGSGDYRMTDPQSIFERRLKYYNDPQGSFTHHQVQSEIGIELVEEEFRYENYLSFRVKEEFEVSIEQIKLQITNVQTQNRKRDQLGVQEFEMYMRRLLKVTEGLNERASDWMDVLRINGPFSLEEDVCYRWFEMV